MDTPRKLIIGYDLCEDYTQISCYSYKTSEPIQIETGKGMDNTRIPTALCIHSDTGQWLYGEEAVRLASRGGGILIDQLITKLVTGEELEIFQQKFNGISLLEKYLRKTLTLVKNYFPTETITKMVVTLPDTKPDIVDGVYAALSLMGLEKDRVVVMSHAGAYLYYALSQERTLWMNDVGLFDFSQAGFHFYQISINRRSKPMIAGLTVESFTDTLNINLKKDETVNLSYIFKNIADSLLYKKIISTLYFTGEGFEGGWADDIIKSLCRGKRGFVGQNLFTKGACYAAKELSGDQQLSDIVLINDDMIISNLLVRVYCDARMKDIPLLEAGVPWYEVHPYIEVIPESDVSLELEVQNIITRDINRVKMQLDVLPDRPDRMTRLQLKLACTDQHTAFIQVYDLGFGDIYPGTGLIKEYSIEV